MWEWEEIFLESYVKTIHGVPSIQLGLKYEFPGGSDDKVSAYKRETWVRSLGWEDLPEKEMATHSSTLAWKIP